MARPSFANLGNFGACLLCHLIKCLKLCRYLAERNARPIALFISLAYDKAIKLKDRISDLKDVGTAFGLIVTIAVLFGSVLTFLIVGAWDGAVWLFKADWRTTNFQVPFWAFVVAIPAYLFNRMFADWMKDPDHNSRRD